MRAVSDKVIIEVLLSETMTAGGLHLPGNHQQPSTTGIVLSAGPKCKDLKGGERVIFWFHGGQEHEISGKKYRVCAEHDVIAVIG